MEDAENKYLSPKEASQYFATKPSVTAITQWMRLGVADHRTKGSGRIRLRYIREGGFSYTTKEWIDEFKAACQANFNPNRR